MRASGIAEEGAEERAEEGLTLLSPAPIKAE
jgi:hypothetical protein